jgi:zinc/manganese transport system substrate-binding protein
MRTIIDMARRRALAALTTAVIAIVAAGCGDDGGASGEVQVAASTTQVADLARNVAGDRAEVTGILTPNSDPHEYEPTPSDAQSVADADLVLQSGGDLDVWLDQVVESSGSDAPVVTLIDSIQTIEGEEDGEIETDPHWWQNPANAIVAVERIRDALDEVDPEGADDYDANAASYVASLKRLDHQIAACIDRIPAAQRKLVTSHDALGYYADRYGLDVVGAAIPGLSTQAQASAGETADLIELIDRLGVKAIFPEAGVSQSLEQAIAGETDATVGAELWADALGPADSTGATYLEAMAMNTQTIVDGLSGGQAACEISVD